MSPGPRLGLFCYKDVAAIRIGGQSEVDVTIDLARIARLGVNIGDVNNTIQTAGGPAGQHLLRG